MKVKNEEWLLFKNKIIQILKVFDEEKSKIELPNLTDDEFSLFVEGKCVNPVLVRKGELQRVEYDFSLCNIKIRTLSFSKYDNSVRVELTLKKTNNG